MIRQHPNWQIGPLVELMSLVFTHMPGESYCRRLLSLLCLCDIFPVSINSFVCWFWQIVQTSVSGKAAPRDPCHFQIVTGKGKKGKKRKQENSLKVQALVRSKMNWPQIAPLPPKSTKIKTGNLHQNWTQNIFISYNYLVNLFPSFSENIQFKSLEFKISELYKTFLKACPTWWKHKVSAAVF